MPQIVSPIDGQATYAYTELRIDTALQRLSAAESAQRLWREEPLSHRVAVCRAMLDAYRRELDVHAQQITEMMGKPLAQARSEFTRAMTERTLHMCEIAETSLRDIVLPSSPGVRRFIRHEPVGVVLDIAAWNYPLLVAINVVVPAVLAGNAVLIKHADQTALVADQFERAFELAGAPPGLVQALPVDHTTVAALLATRRIGQVSFTGSVRGGREVAAVLGHTNVLQACFEMGGKDPALVLPDAAFDFTVDNLVDGAFYNAGQSCCAVERIYVHRSLFERFVEAFAAKVRSYRMGDPRNDETTLGPLATPNTAQKVRKQIDSAMSAGARLVVGPEAFDVPDGSSCYVAPHVFIDVDHSMALMRDETFGPAIGLMAFDTIDEAIALANDSSFGLSASIWTTDLDRGAAAADRIDSGTVFINRCDYIDPGLAWTGIKDSGAGSTLSTFGFLQVTRRKSHHFRSPS